MENVNTKRELARLDMIYNIVLMYNKTSLATSFFSIEEFAFDVNIQKFFHIWEMLALLPSSKIEIRHMVQKFLFRKKLSHSSIVTQTI